MNRLWGATVAAAALAVAGCNNKAGGDGAATDQTAGATATMPSDSGMAPPTTANGTASDAGQASVDVPTYVRTAASGDMFEIRSSQLALKESEDRQVRDFAQRMITDHQASTAALKKAVTAGAPGTTVPTEMLPRHAQMLQELETAARGPDQAAFDRLYVEQQRTAHAEALNLHRSMAARGDVPAELRDFAQTTSATVDGHHQSLMQMPGAGGGTGASGTMGSVNQGSGAAGMTGAPPGAEGAGAASGSGRVTGAENRATNARPS